VALLLAVHRLTEILHSLGLMAELPPHLLLRDNHQIEHHCHRQMQGVSELHVQTFLDTRAQVEVIEQV
jgi:hypothetical protein